MNIRPMPDLCFWRYERCHISNGVYGVWCLLGLLLGSPRSSMTNNDSESSFARYSWRRFRIWQILVHLYSNNMIISHVLPFCHTPHNLCFSDNLFMIFNFNVYKWALNQINESCFWKYLFWFLNLNSFECCVDVLSSAELEKR